MPEIMQQPRSPDELARLAGKELYGTSVGMLRRAELWRLGNAWGMKFPDGCSKDYMLPFFKQLEAEGKNPLRPPMGTLDTVTSARAVEHSGETHGEMVKEEEEVPLAIEPPDVLKPQPVTDFETKLLHLPHAQLKKMCKLKGIPQERNARKIDLIAAIIAASSV